MEKNAFGNKRILFAAGGTGGHVYPALAVGDQIRRYAPELELKYVCGSRPLEIDLYKRSGVTPELLPLASMSGGLAARAVGAAKLLRGFFAARRLLKNWRPARIMGQGGYVTAPTLLAARSLGIPYDLQEQNAAPGRTNRWFAGGAETIYCSFREAAERFQNGPRPRAVFTGMPLRRELFSRNGISDQKLRQSFGLKTGTPVLLVMGGSQGATPLYRALLEDLYALDAEPGARAFQCLWSAGERNYEWIKRALEKRPLKRITISVFPYIDNVAGACRIADLAVSRAGACSVAELMATGTPSLFVPLPHDAQDHQTRNASAAERKGAAIIVRQDELSGGRLRALIRELLDSEETRREMAKIARGIFPKNAAERIAGELVKKMKNNS